MSRETQHMSNVIWAAAAAAAVAWGVGTTVALATEPCGDFGACKALVEINSSDGDIGFHFLKDGGNLKSTEIKDPNGKKIFEDKAKGALKKQTYTEIFGESAEPLCWEDPDADPDEEIVTLEEFLDRWEPGTYSFSGKGAGKQKSKGETVLTFDLPAAPINVSYDDSTGVISWSAGIDLGQCATSDELAELVSDGVLPTHPMDVPVSVWEIAFAPDVTPPLKLTVRVPASRLTVTVPADYLNALLADTAGIIEVGAIGVDDNATFTEEEICINESAGC